MKVGEVSVAADAETEMGRAGAEHLVAHRGAQRCPRSVALALSTREGATWSGAAGWVGVLRYSHLQYQASMSRRHDPQAISRHEPPDSRRHEPPDVIDLCADQPTGRPHKRRRPDVDAGKGAWPMNAAPPSGGRLHTREQRRPLSQFYSILIPHLWLLHYPHARSQQPGWSCPGYVG